MEETKRVNFLPGGTSAELEGAVVGGDRDRYLLKTRAGKRIRVGISSLDACYSALKKILSDQNTRGSSRNTPKVVVKILPLRDA